MSSGDGSQEVVESPASLRIALLGEFRVWVGPHLIPAQAWKRRKACSLVKLLALDARHRMHREQLMELFWPQVDLDTARNNLRQTLHLARRILQREPPSRVDYLCDYNAWLSLAPDGCVWVDVEAFETAAAGVRGSDDPAVYQAALALYPGELLPDDLYEDWLIPRRETLRRLHLDLMSELGAIFVARGDFAQAMQVYHQVIAIDATAEQAHQALMRLYAAAGRRQDALRQYRQLQHSLRQELAVDPDPDSQRLYASIQSGHFQPPPSHRAGGENGRHSPAGAHSPERSLPQPAHTLSKYQDILDRITLR